MRIIAIVIVSSLLNSPSAFAQDLSAEARSAKVEADAWRKVAESIPLGTKVKVQTYEGRRFSGTLMRVDGKEILVKKNTRRPEPAVSIPFDDISTLEREQKNGTGSIGKAIAVGLATGTGVILSLFLIALQFD